MKIINILSPLKKRIAIILASVLCLLLLAVGVFYRVCLYDPVAAKYGGEVVFQGITYYGGLDFCVSTGVNYSNSKYSPEEIAEATERYLRTGEI